MDLINKETRDLIDRSVLCWLATSDESGRPNVSPKEIFRYEGSNRLLIADIASPRSVSNIITQPHVCVSLVSIFEEKGVKLIGTATIMSSDHPDFNATAHTLIEMAGPEFPIKNAILISVEKTHPIIAPSFYLKPTQSIADKKAAAYRSYGVRPISSSSPTKTITPIEITSRKE